jgi:hypothetical protein
MRRGLAGVAGLVALTALTGCQTWQDKADAAALTDCAKIAEPEKRGTCQTEVMTAAGDAERRQLEEQREAALAREEREALRQAYGLPKRAH